MSFDGLALKKTLVYLRIIVLTTEWSKIHTPLLHYNTNEISYTHFSSQLHLSKCFFSLLPSILNPSPKLYGHIYIYTHI